jgi:hypothetical protein
MRHVLVATVALSILQIPSRPQTELRCQMSSRDNPDIVWGIERSIVNNFLAVIVLIAGPC